MAKDAGKPGAGTSRNVGRVVSVIGPVVDVEFKGTLPEIHNAIHVQGEPSPGVKLDVTLEVQQHIGHDRVRTVALEPTDGMIRGMEAVDEGAPISVPVGRETLGRVMNVLGKPVDKMGPVSTAKRYPIHRPAPTFEDQSGEQEML